MLRNLWSCTKRCAESSERMAIDLPSSNMLMVVFPCSFFWCFSLLSEWSLLSLLLCSVRCPHNRRQQHVQSTTRSENYSSLISLALMSEACDVQFKKDKIAPRVNFGIAHQNYSYIVLSNWIWKIVEINAAWIERALRHIGVRASIWTTELRELCQ